MRGSPKDPNSPRYQNRRLIVELLKKEPATLAQIAATMGMSTSGVRKHISNLHAATPKQVYVCGWSHRVGGRGGDGAAPIYRAGSKRDVEFDKRRARMDASTRYRAKFHGLLLAKAAVKRGTFNPFWQLTASSLQEPR
jgi:hypothetical protein